MQLFLDGINPLFWQQVAELPDGVYNKDNNQTTSAAVPQLLTAFIDRAVGTEVDIYMSVDNGTPYKMTSAKVVNNGGFLYAKLPIPYTQALDKIEFTIKERGPLFSFADKTIASEMFSASHIAYMFEIQAKAMNQTLIDANQLAQNLTIEGVEDQLLDPKFGSFTGLSRRADQDVDTYRSQTKCLWGAFQYAGTEEGIRQAISCVIGDYDFSQFTVTITPTKSLATTVIHDVPQFDNRDPATANFPSFTPDQRLPLDRFDAVDDYPHFYVLNVGATGRGFYTDSTELPLDTYLDAEDDADPNTWNSTTAKPFLIYSRSAIGNEVETEITSVASLGIPEELCIATVVGEQIWHQTTGTDRVANPYVAVPIEIKRVVQGGIEIDDPALMPIEGIDFTVDRMMGEITWLSNDPDPETSYTVNYRFRLDNQLRIVLRKIKPVHKKVIIYFSNLTSGLPKSVEI